MKPLYKSWLAVKIQSYSSVSENRIDTVSSKLVFGNRITVFIKARPNMHTKGSGVMSKKN